MLRYKFRFPVSVMSQSCVQFVVAPYGYGEEGSRSRTKLCVGYNLSSIATEVTSSTNALLDGTVFSTTRIGRCNVWDTYMPLSGTTRPRPEALRGSGTLVFKLKIAAIQALLVVPAKRPELHRDRIRELLGPLRTDFYPDTESDWSSEEEDED